MSRYTIMSRPIVHGLVGIRAQCMEYTPFFEVHETGKQNHWQ